VVPSSERRFCPVYSGDLATAISLASSSGQSGSIFTIAGECINLGEFIDGICESANVRRPLLRVPSWIAVSLLRVAWALRPITRITPPLAVSSLRSSEAFDGSGAAEELGFEYTPLSELF